jgi:hypothetical protein
MPTLWFRASDIKMAAAGFEPATDGEGKTSGCLPFHAYFHKKPNEMII